MHVLIVPRGIYTLPRMPASSIFEQQQAETLRSAGCIVGVLSGGVVTARHLGRRVPYSPLDRVAGIPVYRAHRRTYFPARWESPATAADRNYLRIKPLMERYIREEGPPDVIHAHNLLSGGLLARLIAKDFGIPYVVTEHTSTYAFDAEAVVTDALMLSRAAEGANTIIAVGTQLADHLRAGLNAEIARRVVVVPNVVDPVLLKTPMGSRGEPYTVVGLGYLTPRKNYALLLRAFSRADLPQNARLIIGGQGSEFKRLRHLADELGLGSRAEFPGYLSRESVVSTLRRANLFAHPSDSESFGVVLIEALALGSPVLATASGGPEDIVDSHVGLLTPVGDVERFTSGLTEMFNRRDEFDRRVIRDYCHDRFGPEVFVSRMMEIYREAAT